jgi:hypothetical protein
MQRTSILIGLVSMLLVRSANADPTPYSATIVLPEVEVRSGPSMQFYATSKLRYGDTVRVRAQESNWLAIDPPLPGPESFSWVNASEVDQVGQSVIVKVEKADLRAGSRLRNEEPSVIRAKVPKGTQLTIIGKPETGRDGTWLPVLPAPSEVRYIPVEAVRAGATTAQHTAPPMTAQQAAPSPTTAQPTFNNPATVSAPPGKNPLLIEAEKAEQNGNYARAIQLYEELAKQVSLPDHSLAVQCWNRSQYLRNAQQGGTAIAQRPQSRPGDTYYSNNASGRLTSAPASYQCVPPAPPSSQYCYQPDSQHTVRLVAPSTIAPPLASQSAQWYGPVRIRRTSFNNQEDGKQMFALEDDRRQLLMYVTAGNGIDLNAYLSRTVNVFGVLNYHGVLRQNYMVVAKVAPAQ